MHICEIRYPGSRLDEPNAQHADELLKLIRTMLVEAMVALELFEQFANDPTPSLGIGCPSEEDRRRAWEIATVKNLSDPHQVLTESLMEVYRARWRAGDGPPHFYRMGKNRIAAKAFVYALDTLVAAARALGSDPALSARVGTPVAALAA